jgi:hypothetical protein
MHGTMNLTFEKTLCKWEIYVPLVTKGLYEIMTGTNKRYDPAGSFRRRNISMQLG